MIHEKFYPGMPGKLPNPLMSLYRILVGITIIYSKVSQNAGNPCKMSSCRPIPSQAAER